MSMTRIGRFLAVILFNVIPLSAAVAQNEKDDDPLREKAMEFLSWEVGTWRSREEILDADGNLARTQEFTITYEWTLDNTALHMEVRDDGKKDWSQVIKFYSPKDKEIIFFDVSTTGEYYLMRQDVESKTVLIKPNELGDFLFRLRHMRRTENELDFVIEYSNDDGQTWTLTRRTYSKRVSRSVE